MGKGIYATTDVRKAIEKWREEYEDGEILQCKLTPGRVVRLNDDPCEPPISCKSWCRETYDTAWMPPLIRHHCDVPAEQCEQLSEICVGNPNHIHVIR